MKHPFIKSVTNALSCAVCKRTEIMHKELAECEACNNVGSVELINGMALCASCFDNEKNAKVITPAPAINYGIHTANEVDAIVRDQSSTSNEKKSIDKIGFDALQKRDDFFNRRVQSITEMFSEVDADTTVENKSLEKATRLREHYLNMKRVLFEAVEVQLQCATEQRADQMYLNQLAIKLRADEREKLHLENIDYEPKAPPKSIPSGPKLSKTDKLVEQYAKVLGIPVAQAKRLMESGLKEAVGDCTCKETPGICAVHK